MYRLVLHGGSHMKESVKTLESPDFFDYISDEQKQQTAKDIIYFLYLLNPIHVIYHLLGDEKNKQKSEKKEAKETIESWIRDIRDVSI